MSLYVLLLMMPPITLLVNFAEIAGLFSFLDTPRAVIRTIARGLALYGITLVFAQVTICAFMEPLAKVFGMGLRKFHMVEGVVAYSIILSHPILYAVYRGRTSGVFGGLSALLPNFGAAYEGFVTVGVSAIVLLTVGVSAGILRRRSLLVRIWRKIHWMNYAVFAFVIVHSLFVGSDVTVQPFISLYPVFIAGLVAAIYYRHLRSPAKRAV